MKTMLPNVIYKVTPANEFVRDAVLNACKRELAPSRLNFLDSLHVIAIFRSMNTSAISVLCTIAAAQTSKIYVACSLDPKIFADDLVYDLTTPGYRVDGEPSLSQLTNFVNL